MNGPIGIDLDNTIISYNKILYNTAVESGLISNTNINGKKEIRDTIRALPDGENEWQRLQAEIYGPRIHGAELLSGVKEFFARCKSFSIETYIISHKTEFANYDTTNTNLRWAALDFLKKNNLIDSEKYGIKSSNIYFESTRIEKIKRIREKKCVVFIDDLEETFAEATFPKDITKILFDPHYLYQNYNEITVCHSWHNIKNLLLPYNS